MKPKTIIILVIAGNLLLIVGVLTIYIARGGKVLYRYPYGGQWGCYKIFVPIEQEETAKEIVALDFTFDMTPELEIRFKGGNPFSGQTYQIWPTTDTGRDGTVIGYVYLVNFGLHFKGYIRYSFPFEEPYVDFSEEELLERIASEVASRISPDAEFQVKSIGDSSPWGERRVDLKTLPKKPK